MAELTYAQAREVDLDSLAAVLSQSFHFSEDGAKTLVRKAGRQARTVRDGDEVVGGLLIHEMRQWYGGRPIPMGGIGAVGVAPHVRGRGVGRFLMAETVRELRRRDIPLSTLYASTQRLYRAVGYEQAGTFYRYEVPTRSVPRFATDLPVDPIDARDTAKKKSILARMEKPHGWVERDDLQWQFVEEPWENRVFAWTVGPREAPEGYLYVIQSGGADGYVVHAKDLVALTREARERIWTLIGDHRSLGRTCRFDGGATDPNLLLFPEQEYRVQQMDRWLLRIADVPAALAARGYPAHLDAEIHLDVSDDVVPENAGRHLLRLAGGEAVVEPGGEGRLRLDVRTLAPLFSGLYPAKTLAALGHLTADAESLEVADAAFGGPEPWMLERF